ncbi:MAG: tRNA (N6-isopentenyl adenosine(37)-C2)-methylthiotransferase MiaB [Planctomycetia bacterium]|nr:tRNA (N6-isopentenyl adenosine(37)-C2)-methylthiotransferase MiaB [Planctomycetia bacterium]
MPRLWIDTVGCQMNVLDSELVVAALRRQGWDLAATTADADAVFFNTCSVRQHAEDKVYSALGRIRLEKERRPGLVVGVLGCMAQKDQALVRSRAPWVDLVVGPGQLHRVPVLVEAIRAGGGPQVEVALGRTAGSRVEIARSFESYDPDRDPTMRPNPFQAFVRTQTGCDKFCSFCVVPHVRGPEQARAPDTILAEARRLVAEGCREITLIGQTVNSYRWTGGGTTHRLADLLVRLDAVAGLDRIRFVTNYPRDMTPDLVAAVRDLPKVCPYLHVPAQHGSDAVLARMRRGYTISEYREMFAMVRAELPHAAVTSDFIVGFCGETDAEFQATLDLVRESGFKNSFIFKYSPRPGTKAFQRQPDDVPEGVKKERHRVLLDAQTEASRAGNLPFVGTRQQVLVEGLSVRDEKRGSAGTPPAADGEAQLTGRTPCDRIVVFDAPLRLVGRLVDVDIVAAGPWSLGGLVAESAAGAPVPGGAEVACGTPLPLYPIRLPGVGPEARGT